MPALGFVATAIWPAAIVSAPAPAGTSTLYAIDELFVAPDQPPARVVKASSAHVISGDRVHVRLLAELLDEGLCRLLDAADAGAAWGLLLTPDDIVGIKFDSLGQRELGTVDALAEVLVASLSKAGWDPSRVVLIDAPDATAERLGTRPALSGFDAEPVDAAGRPVRLRSALRQVSALISVAPVRTDNVCSIRGTLANLSLACVREEAALRRNDCTPGVAGVVSLPQIGPRLRLAIADALRPVYRNGPIYGSDNATEAGALFISADPVALDAIGLLFLSDLRADRGLPPLAGAPAEIPAIADCHRAGLGIALRRRIDVVQFQR